MEKIKIGVLGTADIAFLRFLPSLHAINYSLNQWSKLIVFMKDGRLELDNNRAERSIKPFVMGRKAWIFAQSMKGATAVPSSTA